MVEDAPAREGMDYLTPGMDLGEPALRRFGRMVRTRIWVILAVLLIMGTWGLIRAFNAPPVYEAGVKVLVNRQGPRVLKFDEVVQTNAWEVNYVWTQIEVVKSRAILEKALSDPEIAKMFKTPKDVFTNQSFWGKQKGYFLAALHVRQEVPPDPWERLRDEITVEKYQETQVVLIKSAGADPVRAAKIANAVATAYVQYQVEGRTATNKSAFRFLQEQREKAKLELFQADEALQQCREEAKMLTLDIADKDNPVLTMLYRLNEALAKVQLERIDKESQFMLLKQLAASNGKSLQPGDERVLKLPAVKEDPVVGQLQGDLVSLEKEILSLSVTAGPENPQLRTAEMKREYVLQKLRAAMTPVVSGLSVQLEVLKNQEQELQKDFDKQNQLSLDLAKQSLKYQRLQQDVERQRKLFDVLLDRLREVDLSSELSQSNVAILEEASVPKVPTGPNKPRMVLTSCIFGLVLGLFLAYVVDRLDDTVKTVDDLEQKIGLPALGFVPEMRAKNGGDGFSGRASVCLRNPSSPYAEAYRNIRTNLAFSAPEDEAKIIVVTSTHPEDGKSTLAANLSLTLAQGGKRVLLVDADLRKPSIQEALGLQGGDGLSTLLVGGARLEDVVQKVGENGKIMANLDVLVSGPKSPNPAELLDSHRMRKLLAEAREKYDRVIVDVPPVLTVADASIVCAMGDGVVVVLRASKNTCNLTRRTLSQLMGVKARILGGVLNYAKASHNSYYRPYYYGRNVYPSQ